MKELPKLIKERKEGGTCRELRDSYHLYNGVISAMALVAMERARRESRGSHFREDYPHHDEALKSPMVIELKNGLWDFENTESNPFIIRQLNEEE